MLGNWNAAVITKIGTAVRVEAGKGRTVHNDRPFHGLVINCGGNAADYIFSDGTVLHTEARTVFYLPKGSSYKIRRVSMGQCYAINFDLKEPVAEKPFMLSLRDSDGVLQLFKKASACWRQNVPTRQVTVMACLYEILEKLLMQQQNYLPSSRESRLEPAIHLLQEGFTQGDLSVADMAKACGVSQPYFRKLFSQKYGMNPKQYVTKLRMEQAAQLLMSGDFSVTEIAALCGYAEPCHFTREFTKFFGASPLQYKNKT